jgi:hypothetical protein
MPGRLLSVGIEDDSLSNGLKYTNQETVNFGI